MKLNVYILALMVIPMVLPAWGKREILGTAERESGETILTGTIILSGNEPHTVLLLKTGDGNHYEITGDLISELYLYQNQKVEITGCLDDNRNLEAISFSSEYPAVLPPTR